MLGGRHYVTFDRRRFSFLGACAYTLVQVSAAPAVAGMVAVVVARAVETCPGGLCPGDPGTGGLSRVSDPPGLRGGAAADHGRA